jgi:hypothetical protein
LHVLFVPIHLAFVEGNSSVLRTAFAPNIAGKQMLVFGIVFRGIEFYWFQIRSRSSWPLRGVMPIAREKLSIFNFHFCRLNRLWNIACLLIIALFLPPEPSSEKFGDGSGLSYKRGNLSHLTMRISFSGPFLLDTMLHQQFYSVTMVTLWSSVRIFFPILA